MHAGRDGGKQAIGNDYSHDIPIAAFMERYVLEQDPKAKTAAFPPKIRQAIESARVMPGMTREQVFMAVGYPVSSENPTLDVMADRRARCRHSRVMSRSGSG